MLEKISTGIKKFRPDSIIPGGIHEFPPGQIFLNTIFGKKKI
jgi:hypothetical protein